MFSIGTPGLFKCPYEQVRAQEIKIYDLLYCSFVHPLLKNNLMGLFD